MSKSDAFESDLLKLIFNATTITSLAANATTAPNANLYVSLHTADPTDAGNEGSSEATYTGYARVAVARTTAGWTITQTSGVTTASLTSPISFPAGTGGSGTATFFGVGMAASGATELLYSGAISPTIAMGNGVTPILGTGTSITED